MVAAQLHLTRSSTWRRPLAARVLFALAKLELRKLAPSDGLLAALAEDLAEARRVVGEEAADLTIWRRVVALPEDELDALVATAEVELLHRGMRPFEAPGAAA